MTPGAMELLVAMADAYDADGTSAFDEGFYWRYPDGAVHELEVNGCIIQRHDFAGTIRLTTVGYETARMKDFNAF